MPLFPFLLIPLAPILVLIEMIASGDPIGTFRESLLFEPLFNFFNAIGLSGLFSVFFK